MGPGFIALIGAYVLSQFFRVFLAVLTPALAEDPGMGPQALATASGLWFLAFAAMQVPVGIWLDRFGPRRTSGYVLLFCGAGGAAAMAIAQTPLQVTAAVMLIGAGCSPVLMAAYVIFARSFRPALFGTLASVMVAVGSAGNLAGSAPLAAAVAAWGWRGTVAGLAVITLLAALAVLAFLRDPPPVAEAPKGSVAEVLRLRALWPVFAIGLVAYAPSASVRGLWAGPYLGEVFGADAAGIGRATLVMGIAMIAGSLLYGPVERLAGSRKRVILVGNLCGAAACLGLGLWPAAGVGTATVLMAALGLFGATFGLIVAHGRAFVPPHLTGRGVTMVNLFAIAGAGIAQVALAPLFAALGGGTAAFGAVFLTFGLAILAGCLWYLKAEDRQG